VAPADMELRKDDHDFGQRQKLVPMKVLIPELLVTLVDEVGGTNGQPGRAVLAILQYVETMYAGGRKGPARNGN